MFFLQNYTLLRNQLKNIPRTFVMSLVYSYILHFSVISKRCVCVCVCVCVHVHASSVMSDSAARQAPLSIEIFRQEYWSGLPFPLPGDLPDPGTEPYSPALIGRFFTLLHLGHYIKLNYNYHWDCCHLEK